MKAVLCGDRRKAKRQSKRAVRIGKGSICEFRRVMKKEGKRCSFLYNLLQ